MARGVTRKPNKYGKYPPLRQNIKATTVKPYRHPKHNVDKYFYVTVDKRPRTKAAKKFKRKANERLTVTLTDEFRRKMKWDKHKMRTSKIVKANYRQVTVSHRFMEKEKALTIRQIRKDISTMFKNKNQDKYSDLITYETVIDARKVYKSQPIVEDRRCPGMFDKSCWYYYHNDDGSTQWAQLNPHGDWRGFKKDLIRDEDLEDKERW